MLRARGWALFSNKQKTTLTMPGGSIIALQTTGRVSVLGVVAVPPQARGDTDSEQGALCDEDEAAPQGRLGSSRAEPKQQPEEDSEESEESEQSELSEQSEEEPEQEPDRVKWADSDDDEATWEPEARNWWRKSTTWWSSSKQRSTRPRKKTEQGPRAEG